MPKRSKPVSKKSRAKKSSSGYKTEKFSFNDIFTKKHRPLHFAGLGVIMVFLQGLLAAVGVLIIVSAALVYAFRAYKSETR